MTGKSAIACSAQGSQPTNPVPREPGNSVKFAGVGDLMHVSTTIGASVTIFAGLIGLIWPQRVSRVIGFALPGKLGVSEFRATYGGLFIGAGAAVLAVGSADVALVLGVAWLGAFTGRVVSLVVDRSFSKENLVGCAIELAVGGLLVLGR